VGLNVIIMPVCNIGKNSFIMSNAVITESVGENSYVTNGYRKSKKQFRFEFSE
jgi:carbonic anhydrase/acetyltransferase-like protein (isoleucine patch superfamily)